MIKTTFVCLSILLIFSVRPQAKSVENLFPPLSTTASIIANVTCIGQSSGNAEASPLGGVSPYTYYWSNGGVNHVQSRNTSCMRLSY